MERSDKDSIERETVIVEGSGSGPLFAGAAVIVALIALLAYFEVIRF